MYLYFIVYIYTFDYSNNNEYDSHLTKLSHFQEGYGYNTYTNRLSERKCFKPIKILKPKTSGSSFILSFSIETHFIMRNIKLPNYEEDNDFILNGNLMMKYFSIIKEETFSFIHNYYSFKETYKEWEYNFDNVLTAEGKDIFDNDNDNFAALCGDSLIKRLDVGMGLIYSFKVTFNTINEKNKYVNSLGKNYRYEQFTTFLYQLKRNFNSIGIYRGKVELFAIQFGGFYKNELIKNARSKEFLISSCTIDNIDKCNNYIIELNKYASKDFQYQKDIDEKFIPLFNKEIISLKKITQMTFDEKKIEKTVRNADEYRDELIIRIKNIKNVLYQLTHLNDFYPFNIIEAKGLREKIIKYYYDELDDLKVKKCYDDVYNIDKCAEEILQRKFDFGNFIKELKTFINRFETIEVYSFTLKGNDCIPKYSSWSISGKFNLRVYRDQYSIENSFGMKCSKYDRLKLECSDGVVKIEFDIKEKEKNVPSIVTCYNSYFPDFALKDFEIEKSNEKDYDFNIILL